MLTGAGNKDSSNDNVTTTEKQESLVDVVGWLLQDDNSDNLVIDLIQECASEKHTRDAMRTITDYCAKHGLINKLAFFHKHLELDICLNLFVKILSVAAKRSPSMSSGDEFNSLIGVFATVLSKRGKLAVVRSIKRAGMDTSFTIDFMRRVHEVAKKTAKA